MNYKGFISYKHGADDALAERLENTLEKFAKPTFKRRAIEIFRDGNDLSAAADLGEKIRNGLENSEYFICMASSAYSKSKWCVREAEWWRDNKSIDKFLIVLTEGEILWDESTNDFDWNVTTALPKALSGVFNGEPFYIDFREPGPKENMTLNHPEFKNKVVYIAASLHEKNVGDMIGEAMKQHKRTLRIRNSALTLVFSLMAIALFLSISSIKRRIASQLHFQAKALVAEDPSIALRVEAAALKRYDFVEFRNTAQSIIANNNFYKIISKRDSLEVKDVALSPIDNSIAVSYLDGSVVLMDLNGNVTKQFKAHDDEINSIEFSPDGTSILTASYDQTAKLWDLEGTNKAEFLGHTKRVNKAVFTPNGNEVLTASTDGSLRLYDLSGNSLRIFEDGNYGFEDVSVAPDGQSFLALTTGLSESNAVLWPLDSLQKAEIRLPWLSALSLSPDGEKILTGHTDGQINLLAKTGDTLWQHQGPEAAVMSVAFSPDGLSMLIAYANGDGQQLDQYGELIDTFIGHHQPIHVMKYTIDGKAIVTASFDKTLRLWQLERTEKTAIQKFEGLKGFINAVSFSPNGKQVFGADENGDAILWDNNGTVIQKMNGQNFGVGHAAFLNNGKSILTTSQGGAYAQLWQIDSDMPTQFKQDLMHYHPEAISPDGSLIFLGANMVFGGKLWNLDNNTITEFEDLRIESAAFAPDGQSILIGCKDGKARLFNLEGKLLKEYEAHGYIFTSYSEYPVTSVAIAEDDETIAMGSADGTIRISKLKGRVLADFNGHKETVNSLSFSPDSKSLLSVSYDKTARLWDLRGTMLSDFSRESGEVASLAFSADGRSLLAGGTDGKVRQIRFINVEDFLDNYVQPLNGAQRTQYDVD